MKSSAEISSAVNGVFAELAASKNEIILFVDSLANFVGNSQFNNAVASAILKGQAKIIGGSSAIIYDEKIESNAEVAGLFETITIGKANNNETIADNEGFRGDNVSADLRDMMAADPTGKKRVDVILQSKDADNQLLRNVLAQNNVRLTDRIGNTDTVVVNLPLSAVEILAQSGLINYMSPDRVVKKFGQLEKSIGTDVVRAQPATAAHAAYSLDGSGIGIAIVDSGMAENHKSFKNGTSSRVVFSKNLSNRLIWTDTRFTVRQASAFCTLRKITSNPKI